MAITFPVYQQSVALAVQSAASGAETTAANAVQLRHSAAAADTIASGAIVGLAIKHTSHAGGGGEKITIRLYRANDGSNLSDLCYEADATFVANNDQGYADVSLPIPFFSGIWATTASTGAGYTGAQETVEIKLDSLAIAGH